MRDKDTIEWMQNLKKAGFEDYQIDYLEKAGELYRKGKVNSVDDIESELGYGVVDSGILRDTFDLRENVIEIKEDVKINNDVILEAGDRIEVLSKKAELTEDYIEAMAYGGKMAGDLVDDIIKAYSNWAEATEANFDIPSYALKEVLNDAQAEIINYLQEGLESIKREYR